MSMSDPVKVSVTDKSAIYVNDTRITDRGTKWGMHQIIDEFACDPADVRSMCLQRGHNYAVKRINDPAF